MHYVNKAAEPDVSGIIGVCCSIIAEVRWNRVTPSHVELVAGNNTLIQTSGGVQTHWPSSALAITQSSLLK